MEVVVSFYSVRRGREVKRGFSGILRIEERWV